MTHVSTVNETSSPHLLLKAFSPPVHTSSLMTRCQQMIPAVLFCTKKLVSNTFQTPPLCLSVARLPSNPNLQVKTNMWRYAIIGTNWATLFIQICCLLPPSRHINNLSSDRSALSDISANELVSAACQRQKRENGRWEVEIVFVFCNYSRKFSN